MLPFVPRKVAQSLKSKARSNTQVQDVKGFSHQNTSVVPIDQPELPSPPVAGPSKGQKDKAKETQPTPPYKDYAALLLLSLTSHALWANGTLRHAIETGDEGYVPLSYLIAESPYLAGCGHEPEEGALVRAVRMHAAEELEVRMIMSEPSRAVWYGRRVDSGMGGGYEVRARGGYREATMQGAQAGTREGWDSRTVYVLEGSVLRPWRLQSISLPRHHQDKPDDQPKCKGFALVTLAEDDDVHALLSRWPWTRNELNGAALEHEVTRNAERDEAIKFGFRVLEKAAWQRLNKEYIAYRQRLLDEITREESAAQVEYTTSTAADEPKTSQATQEDPTPSMDPNAPFPQNCLVFVRNVHPETNKTTLRKLLSRAFEASGTENFSEAIDYVDFNKGMTSVGICFLTITIGY
ncbi:hypothetical protein EIP86_000408 [Pleurotus ostreatoroseus]|nr:hypothetical protein EIP86_000408 [Pleurotus ostreatoroseus]